VNTPSQSRQRYIDWARGLAVLVMIEAHTADAWTHPADRRTSAFQTLMLLGGLAAPLFLWLAGLGVVLSAESVARRTASRQAATLAACKRGLEIFILAFLFRLQAFVVSPGSYPVTLFRVDILNVMGPAMLAAGLVWAVASDARTSTLAFALLAVLTAMLTPPIRAAGWVDALPTWVQWYLRPAGDNTTFMLFPWAGFVFAGGAVGVLVSRARDARAKRLLRLSLGGAGLAVTGLGFYTALLPTIYRASSFWTSSPTYFAERVGIAMLALTAMSVLETVVGQRRPAPLAALERLGRSSLIVYWIHVELVYGYASWPLRRHLRLWQLAVAYCAFSILMLGAVAARDRIVEAWGRRNSVIRPRIA
jgi:uncharacterized membrane protein